MQIWPFLTFKCVANKLWWITRPTDRRWWPSSLRRYLKFSRENALGPGSNPRSGLRYSPIRSRNTWMEDENRRHHLDQLYWRSNTRSNYLVKLAHIQVVINCQYGLWPIFGASYGHPDILLHECAPVKMRLPTFQVTVY